MEPVAKDPFLKEPDGTVVTNETQDPCSLKRQLDKVTPSQSELAPGHTNVASGQTTESSAFNKPSLQSESDKLAADAKQELPKQKQIKVLQTDRMTRRANKAQKQLDLLIQICKKFKYCKEAMKYLLKTNLIRKIEESTGTVAAHLLASQLKSGKKALCGRQFTVEEQIYALSLFKRAPKAYKIVQTVFAVPSPRMLISVLNRVPFLPGVDESMFAHLREKVSELDESNRACALLFHKVPLYPKLQYSEKQNLVVGFTDFGDIGRENAIADHVLIFMIRGLSEKWKQPVAYFFYKDPVGTRMLEKLIVKVIESLQNIGLHVLCTICNQESTYRTSLKNLVASLPSSVNINKPGMIFTVNNENIAVIYDPPQLLVDTRNAFMECNVVWSSEPKSSSIDEPLFIASRPLQKSEASWDHVKMFVQKNKEPTNEHPLAQKVTQAHVEPDNEEEMIVSLAAEIMSHSVAVGIQAMIHNPVLTGNLPDSQLHSMPASAISTSHFLLDVDHLFDSFNGSEVVAVDQKHHRVALTAKSIHTTFWPEIAKLIDSWEFTNRTTGSVQRFPFQDGWLTSIAGATHVGAVLRDKYNVCVLRTQALNLDSLNNLSYMITQHGPDGISLSCNQFTTALKTNLINNLLKVPTRGYNLVDDGDILVSNLKTYLWPDVNESVSAEKETTVNQDPKDLPFESFGYEDISDEIENESAEIDPDAYDFVDNFPDELDF